MSRYRITYTHRTAGPLASYLDGASNADGEPVEPDPIAYVREEIAPVVRPGTGILVERLEGEEWHRVVNYRWRSYDEPV